MGAINKEMENKIGEREKDTLTNNETGKEKKVKSNTLFDK